jgi:predicted kinase
VVHINPDHFLETDHGRVTTPERNRVAWQECYATLERELARQGAQSKVVVLIGPQGAGKSTWARSLQAQDPAAIIFDAILVKRAERLPILESVKRHGGKAAAIWFTTPLAVCISRNAARPADEICLEQAIRNVHAAVEPPASAEGFAEILTVP